MSEGIVPVMVMPIVTPRSERKRSPIVIDESLPQIKDPNKVMNERMQKRIIEKILNKPDEKRTFFDYLILAQNKLKDIDAPVCYMA